jgi:hypothetical protein
LNDLRLIHNQRESAERDLNLPASNAVNDLIDFGDNFTTVV